MAKFKIKKTIAEVFGTADKPTAFGRGNPKGITFDGKTAITDDGPWIKALRNLPKSICEEVAEPEPT